MIENNHVIRELIEKYKQQIRANKLKDEIYKWELVNKFCGRPNIGAEDFGQELKSINFSNLIYPVGLAVIQHLGKDKPEDYRNCFAKLFDDNQPLLNRVQQFIIETLKVYREIVPDEKLSHHHDERTIATFLTYHNPDKYTFYKDSFYQKFCKLIGIDSKPKGEKYVHYIGLIDELIKEYIVNDQELIGLVKDAIPDTLFSDTTHKLLAQDILFTQLDKSEEDIEIGSRLVYKVSMGDFTEEEVDQCIKQNKILVHADTKAKGQSSVMQGEIFKKILDGDFFYLTHGNGFNRVKLIGRIIGPAILSPFKNYGDDGWLERPFEIITYAINKRQYSGVNRWWTPNNNSTCISIKLPELEEANKVLFVPYFNVRFSSKESIIKEPIIPEPENETMKKEKEYPLNQILFGPPGTGKTYTTINKAIKIVDRNFDVSKPRKEVKEKFEELIQAGQIAFTTFHQSMSYEDFIEGIKPLKPIVGDAFVKYEVQPGIFYNICEVAKSNFKNSKKENRTKLSFEEVFEQLKEEWEEDKDLKFPLKSVGYDFTIVGFTNTSIQFEKSNGSRSHTLSIKTLQELYYGREFDFKGGVGIYYPSILAKLNSYQNESSVPVLHKNYVLIIDEINRGNVSQIFGELITLIEEDKRLGKEEVLEVTLPYSKEKFGVPPNLYIIGTMNTADRSVEALDTALRRRFSFQEMPPKYDLQELAYEYAGNKASDILRTINKRIEKLLDKDNAIGHAYFIKSGDQEVEQKLTTSFYKNIIPLLQEYFFGDFGKIGLVLGKGFIRKKEWNKNEDSFAEFDSESSSDYDDKNVYEIIDYRLPGTKASISIKESGSSKEITLDFEKAIKLLMKQSIG